jgi:phosphate transport system ATP-binding protein
MSLSGGQQQRLCIARPWQWSRKSSHGRAGIALDPISTAKIEELIYNLKRNYTIVVVTHNMQQAARISDETGFFLTGRLVEFKRERSGFSLLPPTERRGLHNGKIWMSTDTYLGYRYAGSRTYQ